MASNGLVSKNIEAEIACLGCIFLDDSLMRNAVDLVKVDYFYDEKNKDIYKAMQSLFHAQKSIDMTTITTELEANNKLQSVGGEYLLQVASSSYTTSNFETYCELISQCALKRRTVEILNQHLQNGYDPKIDANQLIDGIERDVLDLSRDKKTSAFSRIADVVSKYKEIEIERASRGSRSQGLDTGFKNLNDVSLGLQPGALIILAARPAMGKSAFAMNVAVNCASLNKNGKASVAVFSLEMSSEQLVERMIASEAKINNKELQEGQISGRNANLYNAACAKLAGLNLYFDDSAGVTISDIRSKCRKLSSQDGLDLVVIDYLQLIKPEDSSKSTNDQVGEISRGLKLLARELKIPVIALSQLSRNVERREGNKPQMSDLRDSGNIEQDADIVMFLYREEYYKKNSERAGEADLIVAKNRSGSTGELKYQFQAQYSKFTAIEGNEETK